VLECTGDVLAGAGGGLVHSAQVGGSGGFEGPGRHGGAQTVGECVEQLNEMALGGIIDGMGTELAGVEAARDDLAKLLVKLAQGRELFIQYGNPVSLNVGESILRKCREAALLGLGAYAQWAYVLRAQLRQKVRVEGMVVDEAGEDAVVGRRALDVPGDRATAKLILFDVVTKEAAIDPRFKRLPRDLRDVSLDLR
jgi:hypothetical protein